jgi:hypothetical protein
MLAKASVTTMLPVIDMVRARDFYERCLGLTPSGFRPDGKFLYHVCVLGAEKAAWFKDTEGNFLCIHEDLA